MYKISIGNRMNGSAFQDLGARVKINPEMHEQVHTIFYLLYIQQNYPAGFAFLSIVHVCQKLNEVCVAFNVFLCFALPLVVQRLFGLTKQTDCQS